MQLSSGTLLERGKYRIIETLGRGGFGITYLAEHTMTRRKVCIKEFFPKDYYKRDGDSGAISLSSDGFAESMNRFKTKFIKEAQTIATFNHPNIIPIHDAFEDNGTAYYVMDYIEGESLNDIIKHRGALDEATAVGYIRQVAKALGYIHEQKIMHLDVKPGNVMLRKEDGRAVLIDFGLSKHYDAHSGEATSTTPVGVSHGYAPLEQYQQGGVSSFSPATDIYSLGATLYYLVTGIVPPQATAVVDDGLPKLPSHLSPTVRNAIERSMEIQRKRRPHSISEFLVLLGDNAPKVAVAPTPAPVGKQTLISTPQPKVEVPKPTQPKKERTPKYAVDNKKTENNSNRGKSRWWLWLLFVAISTVVGYILFRGSEDVSITPQHVGDEEKYTPPQPVAVEGKYTPPQPVGDEEKFVANEDKLERGKPEEVSEKSGPQIVPTESASDDSKGDKLERGNSEKVSEKSGPQIVPTESESDCSKGIGNLKETKSIYNGREWVDLGLPSGLKWATCNVGADSPEEYGDYYAWGETTTTKACSTLNQNIGDIKGTNRDVAHVKWCGNWRMPTIDEFKELIDECTWVWTTQNGKHGCKVIGPNGNSIFLPAAGGHLEDFDGPAGFYWSSTPDLKDTQSALSLYFYSRVPNTSWGYRSDGISVRPVLE